MMKNKKIAWLSISGLITTAIGYIITPVNSTSGVGTALVCVGLSVALIFGIWGAARLISTIEG